MYVECLFIATLEYDGFERIYYKLLYAKTLSVALERLQICQKMFGSSFNCVLT